MKKILLSFLLSSTLLFALGQGTVIRTAPVSNNSSNPSYNKQVIQDANLQIALTFSIPIGPSFTHNNATPRAGELFYNTSTLQFGVFNGVTWDIISTADLSNYYTKSQSDARFQSKIYSNIKDFGAIGDSTTNASAAIQNAINASPTTFIPKGTYLINNTLLIPSDHKLLFEEGAKFKSANGLNKHMIRNADTVSGNVNIDIEGGIFNGNGTNQTDSLSVIYFKKVSNGRMENVSVYAGNGMAIPDNNTGAITFNTCYNMVAYNCSSSNNKGTGLTAEMGYGIIIKGGYYSNNLVSGVDVSTSPGAIITNINTVNNFSSGISLNALYGVVSNNYSSGNKFGINIGHVGGTYNASYSTVVGNTLKDNGTAINIQSGSTSVSVSGNGMYNNTLEVNSASGVVFTKNYNGLSVNNQIPNTNALVNIGANTGSVPANTAIINTGLQPFRWTSGDGNASNGGYINGESNRLMLGTRSGGTDLDVVTITGSEHKLNGRSVIDNGSSTALDLNVTSSGVNGTRMDFNSTLSGQVQNYRIGTNFLLNDREFGVYDVTNNVTRLLFNKDGVAYFSGSARVGGNDGNANTVVRNTDLSTYATTSSLAGKANLAGGNTLSGTQMVDGSVTIMDNWGMQMYTASNTHYMDIRPGTLTADRSIACPDDSGIIALSLVNIVSSAPTLALTANSNTTFNGIASVGTLPAVSGFTGKRITIMNMGSGNVTINSNAGGNDIYDSGSSVNTISVSPGETAILYNNSVKWYRQL